MKKCYLLLFIAIFILNTIATGQKQAIDFISISSGSGIPVGNFSSKNIFNTQAGFARTGYYVDLATGFLIKNNIGLQSQIRFQKNSTDLAELFRQLLAISGPNNAPDLLGGGTWYSSSLLIGSYYKLCSKNNISFAPRCLLGINYIIHTSSDILWAKNKWLLSPVKSARFGFLFGTICNWKLISHFSIIGNIDFNGNSISSKSLTDSAFLNHSILSLNLGIGSSYYF